MATAEEIKQEIVDYLNESLGTKWGVRTVEKINEDFYEFVEAITWRNAEIELKSGTAKSIDFKDAGEGDYSADTHLIFSVGSQIFRVDGHYESWAGGEWEAQDLHEVEPVQVLVTQYQRKGL